MNAAVKSMILKAQDNIETAKKNIDDESQHEVVGYNLAQACEFLLKALLTVRNLEYPHDEEGHDLDSLLTILEEDNLTAISSHGDIVELTPYNSPKAHIRGDERLDLREYLGQVEELKKLVGEHTL